MEGMVMNLIIITGTVVVFIAHLTEDFIRLIMDMEEGITHLIITEIDIIILIIMEMAITITVTTIIIHTEEDMRTIQVG